MRHIMKALGCLAVIAIAGSSGAQPSPSQMITPRMRVAVMDLSGSALKMQMAQAPNAQGGVTTQTTVRSVLSRAQSASGTGNTTIFLS